MTKSDDGKFVFKTVYSLSLSLSLVLSGKYNVRREYMKSTQEKTSKCYRPINAFHFSNSGGSDYSSLIVTNDFSIPTIFFPCAFAYIPAVKKINQLSFIFVMVKENKKLQSSAFWK